MRTDTLKVSLLLAGVLLAGSPHAAAGQETLREEAAAPEGERTGAVEEPAPRVRTDGMSILTGDQVVRAGEVVTGDMVVVGGDLRVEGRIEGNAVVTEGNLVIVEGGTVVGDAVVTGGRLMNEGGRVLGEMRTVGSGRVVSRPAAAPAPPRSPMRTQALRTRSSWFDPIARGISDMVSTLALGLVLAGIGAALIFYALPYLRTVSETVRTSTLRSGAVGLAATFLIVPVFVLLVVALAVTVIGIPLLLVAVPLYPLLVVGAFGFGLVAAAHALGERTAEQRDALGLRHQNAYAYTFFGIGLLLAPLLAAALFEMTGFLDWVGTLLKIAGILLLWAVSTVGLGAVILSRGGRQKVFAAREYDPVLDDDPFLDSEPVAR